MGSYKYFLMLLLVMSCSKYNGDPKSLEYDLIQVEFVGLKGDFYKKGNISFSFTNKEIVNKLNKLKNKSKKASIFSTLKPVKYQIDLVYKNSKTKEQVLVTINCNSNEDIITVLGRDYYRNIELYNYVASLIKLEAIRKYNGVLKQEEYENVIR